MSFPVIFKILSKLQTAKTSDWIADIDDADIIPFMIQKWLSMAPPLVPYANKLNKSLHLKPKQFLLYAWAIIPKRERAIRITYIKKFVEEDCVENIIYNKIRKTLQISDNDWRHEKKYFETDFDNNKVEYFKMFGVGKKDWKKAGLDFNEMKSGGERQGKSGLELFGM